MHLARYSSTSRPMRKRTKREKMYRVNSTISMIILGDGRTFLVGNTFTVADSYLFVVSNWSNFVGIELSAWPNVASFVDRVSQLPAAQQAMQNEGLIN